MVIRSGSAVVSDFRLSILMSEAPRDVAMPAVLTSVYHCFDGSTKNSRREASLVTT